MQMLGKCSGTLVLEPNSFQKPIENHFFQKRNLLGLSLETCLTDHTGISVKGLLGRESRPKVLLDKQYIFSMNNVVGNQIVQEPKCLRTEV